MTSPTGTPKPSKSSDSDIDNKSKVINSNHDYLCDVLQCWLRTALSSPQLISQLQLHDWPYANESLTSSTSTSTSSSSSSPSAFMNINDVIVKRSRSTVQRFGHEWQCDYLLRVSSLIRPTTTSTSTSAFADDSPIANNSNNDDPVVLRALRQQKLTGFAGDWSNTIVKYMCMMSNAHEWLKYAIPVASRGYINFNRSSSYRSQFSCSSGSSLSSLSSVPSSLVHPSSSSLSSPSSMLSCHCGQSTEAKSLAPPPTRPRNSTIRYKFDNQKKNSNHKYEFTSIGTIESIYHKCYGTPRQGSIVPTSRARLVLDHNSGAPEALIGLEEFSHVWIIFVFHANTNLAYHPKIHPPRANGRKLGALATRTPHRPNPIGLTVARLERVEGNILHLSGIDLIDGTPILDVKPYHFADMVSATMPAWVLPMTPASAASSSSSASLSFLYTPSTASPLFTEDDDNETKPAKDENAHPFISTRESTTSAITSTLTSPSPSRSPSLSPSISRMPIAYANQDMQVEWTSYATNQLDAICADGKKEFDFYTDRKVNGMKRVIDETLNQDPRSYRSRTKHKLDTVHTPMNFWEGENDKDDESKDCVYRGIYACAIDNLEVTYIVRSISKVSPSVSSPSIATVIYITYVPKPLEGSLPTKRPEINSAAWLAQMRTNLALVPISVATETSNVV